MKRISAAALTVLTALSLSTGVASAQDLGKGSSGVDSQIRKDFLKWQLESPVSGTLLKEPTSSISAANKSSDAIRSHSSEDTSDKIAESSWGLAKSSVRQDFQNGDPIGTSLDTILTLGGVLALGVIIYNVALQAGFQLPHIAAE